MDAKSLDSIASDISVVDVYDLASEIGKECEKIIDLYGNEAVISIMPKVVNALEMLESLASRNENENTTIQVLTDRVASLESEIMEKAIFREKLQRVKWKSKRIMLHLLSLEFFLNGSYFDMKTKHERAHERLMID